MGKRGLVLGGGGFFGAFQAGAYEELGDFDCIAGASAGALNGWAIASGMPPELLQELWMEAAGSARKGFHFPRFFGDGVLNTRKLEEMVEALMRDWRPRIDIGVVVTQGWDLRQILVRNDDIDADTLLASCAVPLLLPAKRVNGRLSVDGGLRGACPVWAARAMGAREIVGINVWTHLPDWWPADRQKAAQDQGPDVTMIEPPQALGPMSRAALAGPEDVSEWIRAGRETASAIFARQ